MAVRKGSDNMTRKASGTEKKKMSQAEKHMRELEEQDQSAPRYEDFEEGLNAVLADQGVVGEFTDLAVEYVAINAEITRLEARKDAIRKIIKPIVEECGIEKLASDLWVIEQYTSHTPKKLDPLKLLEAGVKQEQIDNSYVGGTPFTTVQIRARAAAGDRGKGE